MDKLKRVVIKEELVVLTGDFKSAIILNQMIYWSERTKDAQKFLKEEEDRLRTALGKEFNEEYILDDFKHGWIYKSSEELSAECMINVNKSTVRRYLVQLIDKGWIEERRNPKYKWDKTLQYRVNIYKIQEDLFKLGYVLEGYPLQMALLSKLQNATSKLQNTSSKLQNATAIPEITTEITTEKKKKEKKESEFDVVIKEYTNNEELRDTLYEFIKMRKSIKASMTTRAVKLLLNNLNKLSNNDNEKIEILNQSILNSWKGIFALKYQQTNKIKKGKTFDDYID